MHPVIVLTELGMIAPGERWQKLILPLEEQLVASGLGRVLEFDSLHREVVAIGFCVAEEVAVELVHLGYGQELVNKVITEASIASSTVVCPSRWLDYHCEEYFAAGWSTAGYFDESSQTPVIIPLSEAYEDVELQFLVVGHSGADGIDFGYRKAQSGIWAYHPIDQEFQSMAATIEELIEGWCSGRLAV